MPPCVEKQQQDFRSEGWQGEIQHRFSIDVRFRGQGYELNVPYTRRLAQAFRREHERRYGYSYPGREMELVTLRVRATIPSAKSRLGRARQEGRFDEVESGNRIPETRPVWLAGKKVAARIYARSSLRPGRKFAGPAIVTEYSATMVVPAGKRFWLDRSRNVLVQIGG